MESDPTSLAWVPIGPQHAEDILALTRAIEENDGVPYRTSFDEVLESFDAAYIWPYGPPMDSSPTAWPVCPPTTAKRPR